MGTPLISEIERVEELEAAAIRERELNEALHYLDRAISRFANQELPSRWSSAHCRLRRQPLPFPGLAPVIRLCAAAFRAEHTWRQTRP
jgi:hypothetical protein